MKELRELRLFPVALFTSVMGIAGVGISLQLFEQLYDWTQVASTIFIVLASVLFLINAGILIYRIFVHREAVREDFNHPLKMNFFGAISISLLLLAVLFYDMNETVSFVIWIVGAVLQLGLTLTLLSKIIWEKEFTMDQFNPTWIIPIVGNIVVPLAGVAHVSPVINWIFFSMGILFTIIYTVFFFQRIFFKGGFPEALTPTLFIVLAPLGIGFVSYVSLTGEVDTFAYILYGAGFYLGLLYLFQFKRFIRIPFTITWWAYLFPSAAMTNATYFMYLATDEAFLKWIFHAQMIGLILLSIYLLYKTISLFVMQRKVN